jgi:hypothetical protein
MRLGKKKVTVTWNARTHKKMSMKLRTSYRMTTTQMRLLEKVNGKMRICLMMKMMLR